MDLFNTPRILGMIVVATDLYHFSERLLPIPLCSKNGYLLYLPTIILKFTIMTSYCFIVLATKPSAKLCYSFHPPAGTTKPVLVIFVNGLGLP